MSNWSHGTRLLHFSVATTVTLQLFVSLLMERPEPGDHVSAFAAFFWEVHESLGVIAVLAILLHWLWLFKTKDTGFHHLFPWGKDDRGQIIKDIEQIKARQPLTGGPGSAGLVGLIHGLGFLAATGMAITGALLFISLPDGNVEAGIFAKGVMELHEGISSLVWIYWFGHVGMAFLHHRTGHDTVKKHVQTKTPLKVNKRFSGK